MIRETRLGPRLDLKLKVVSKIDEAADQGLSLAKGNRFGAAAFDVSTRGMGIVVENLLPSGLVIEMEMDGTAFGLKEKMRITGEIRYCKYVRPHRYKCGVKFLDLSESYLKAINHFVTTYERRKGARLNLSD